MLSNRTPNSFSLARISITWATESHPSTSAAVVSSRSSTGLPRTSSKTRDSELMISSRVKLECLPLDRSARRFVVGDAQSPSRATVRVLFDLFEAEPRVVLSHQVILVRRQILAGEVFDLGNPAGLDELVQDEFLQSTRDDAAAHQPRDEVQVVACSLADDAGDQPVVAKPVLEGRVERKVLWIVGELGELFGRVAHGSEIELVRPLHELGDSR